METTETTPTGSLSVLNVGAGDINVTFNEHDPSETARAVKMLTDMQARGYAILVKLPSGRYARAKEIDGATGHYILMLPEDEAQAVEAATPGAHPVTCECGCGRAVTPGKRFVRGHSTKGRRGRRKVAVPVRQAQAVGVARSAGG